ncbi:uncharacterized protein LOC106867653 [Octopus bimaculoides]|uniref:Uncharacterized protein n=1 Tax=Octopus bimaculoides TaxID=37653 RepID=A0A0L8HZA4_OCTBM|nr:uncharacterized protein LOC106867653 [Octopus bimaculoides]XP_014768070.1 uncharacterized protein LOC106867653 [Octopus bimaculoides]XP_014768071.1 uncharacterized protein LOC106867653 [Octopus bimaculoides]XP_052828784.1 uncharacterized protein LOC106867653 [Octopus bimaculoides]|eukprot:XP_014768069.1 PREDICTED: uncharacterized protein LOC106867653 [Octopus bimaculoides]
MYDDQSDFIQSVYHEVSSSSIYNHLETPHSNFHGAFSFSEAGICEGSVDTPYFPHAPSHLEPEGDETDKLLHNFGKYFNEKLNKEVNTLYRSLSLMVNEQKIHVKQIINAAINYDFKQQSVSGITQPTAEDASFLPSEGSDLLQEFECSNSLEREPEVQASKERYIIQLLTLSSMISLHLNEKTEKI